MWVADYRASMRPQRNAGENPFALGGQCLHAAASMRPQRNAGENDVVPEKAGNGRPGFNEAPAKCRGKRTGDRRSALCWPGFNEAPAKCRGKQVWPPHLARPHLELQ